MRARILLLPLAAALALPALAAPASAAGHGRAASTVVSHAVPGATADHVKALATYWTPQRMREAIRNSQVAAADAPASSPADDAPAAKPTAGATPRILARPRAAASGRARPNAVGISPAQGLVLFTAPNGQNFSCSGGAVNGTYGDMVFTAGHCVYDGGWVSNWTYVPGYDGTAPYGFYTSFNLTTFAGWTDSQDYSYDVGIASVTNGSGTSLADATGANGIIWNSGYLTTVTFSGYPGGQFATCGNVLATQYLLFARLYVACDLGPGASGGPWLQGYDSTTGLGFVNGVDSLGNSTLGISISPYFGDDVGALYTSTESL